MEICLRVWTAGLFGQTKTYTDTKKNKALKLKTRLSPFFHRENRFPKRPLRQLTWKIT